MDRTSGNLSKPISDTITNKAGSKIATLFNQLVTQRNRIIHSFQITDKDDEQKLATKDKKNNQYVIQYVITKEILLEFIKNNEELSTELHKFRGY